MEALCDAIRAALAANDEILVRRLLAEFHERKHGGRP